MLYLKKKKHFCSLSMGRKKDSKLKNVRLFKHDADANRPFNVKEEEEHVPRSYKRMLATQRRLEERKLTRKKKREQNNDDDDKSTRELEGQRAGESFAAFRRRLYSSTTEMLKEHKVEEEKGVKPSTKRYHKRRAERKRERELAKQ
jgi:hypothetical protein